MTNNLLKTSGMTGLVLFSMSGCKVLDKLVDALEGGPQTSYCEALCDWATECADGVSTLSKSEMQERCETATNNADGD